MKHLRLLFVLLLLVNCTTDFSEVDETLEASHPQAEAQNCFDELPKVRLTNNGTDNFDFIVYGQDYSTLHSQIIVNTADSGWIELSDNEVIIVATNDVVYGQKIQLNLTACDNIELEIDTNNILIVTEE